MAEVQDLERFERILASGAAHLDLALALIAATDRPGVDADELVRRLDVLADAVQPGDAESLCRQLFARSGPLGLHGDRSDYYDPDNSLLDRVLERRLGIPITLSVIGIEVARRHGIELVGVGMPGHFLIGDRTTGRFIDAFDAARSFGPDGARVLFHRLHGPDVVFEPIYLAPTPTTAIVARVLNNLHAARLRRGDRPGAITALRLQSSLPGDTVAARAALAEALGTDGRFIEAAEQLELLAELDPGGAELHLANALHLRARLN